jgi:hypothetical protein
MRRKKAGDARTEGSSEAETQGARGSEPQTELELLEQVLERAKTKILSDRSDFSVSDLIRILQAKQEMRADVVREIEVRWVENTDEDGASKK